MSKIRIISLKQTIQVLSISLVVLLAASCEDEPQIVGSNLIPDNDRVTAQYVDTFTVFAHTKKMDSIYSGYNSVISIGNIYDPVFGFTKASLLTEFYPYGIDSLRVENPICDSVKLILNPDGFSGDSSSIMTLNIYEYLTKLPEDTFLYSNFKVDRNNLNRIGQASYQLNQQDLTIILDNDFGNRLLSPPEYSFQEIVDSFELFNNVFKGIYLETENLTTKGGMNYFQLSSVQDAFISVYYHYVEDDSTINVSEFYTFYDPRGIHKNVSLFEHDYSKAYSTPSFETQDSVIYVQSLSGTQAVLKIPGLDNLIDQGPVSVSSAKLILPLEDFDKSKSVFAPPANIGITAIDTDNSEYNLIDNSYITIRTGNDGRTQVVNNYIGGAINFSLEYELYITRHIESVLNGENENLGFNIFAANSLLNQNKQSLYRAVLSSHLNSHPIRLEVVYTKLSN